MTRYQEIVSMPDPLRHVRAMTDHGLSNLIAEIAAVEQANEFQARIFAAAMTEAVQRWKSGLLSIHFKGEQYSPGSGEEMEAIPTQPKGVFQKP